LPHNDTNAFAATVRTTVTSAGYATGGNVINRSVSASSPTVESPRWRWSATSMQNRSKLACASVGDDTRAVRHQRCVKKWIAFSTTPLRFP